mmetsp:Transcript_16322/g.41776  ORF Transcript_16322/g.41776 Transcript_16322/m.41776 type:complete len:311 (-) Transcript_16322:1011-1943(-)
MVDTQLDAWAAALESYLKPRSVTGWALPRCAAAWRSELRSLAACAGGHLLWLCWAVPAALPLRADGAPGGLENAPFWRCSATLRSTRPISSAALRLSCPVRGSGGEPYTVHCTYVISLASSRPEKPSVHSAALRKVAWLKWCRSTSGGREAHHCQAGADVAGAARDQAGSCVPVVGQRVAASATRPMKRWKYIFSIPSRSATPGSGKQMVSSMRSSTAASRSSGRLDASTSMKRVDCVPVRANTALMAARVCSDAAESASPGWRRRRKASASSMNSSTPLALASAQSKILCSSLTASRPSGTTSPPLIMA